MADIESNININIDTSNALANIKQLQAQISAFHQNLSKGSASSNAQLGQMQQNLVNMINQTGNFSAQIKNVATTTETFTNALEKNKLSMGQYFRFAGSQVTGFRKLFSTEFDTVEKVARERVKTLQTQYIKLGRDASGAMKSIAVRPLTLDMENLGTQTAIAAQKQQIFNQLIKQGSTNLLNFGKNTQWAGRQLMVGFTIPLGIAGAAAAREFMKLEEQTLRLQRVYGDFTTPVDELEAMTDSLKDLSVEFTKYGISVSKTMELAADAAAMGKQGQELLDQVTEATRLAVLGGVEQQQALETTTSLTSAFGVATEDLAGKINFLNAVENQTVTSIEDLTEAIPKAGPVVQQLGGDVEDLAYFLTAMKEGGINASEGANALKSGLASMINPTREAVDQLNSFGINIEALRDSNAGDVTKMVQELAVQLNSLSDLNRAQAIETMFGKFQFARMSTLFQNVVAEGSQAQRVLQLTQATTEELAVLSERELKKVEDSPMYKFQGAMEAFRASLAPVGEAFLTAVTPLIEFGTKILEKFNDMSAGAKNFVVVATTLIGGLGPIFLMTFGLIANGIANIIKGFQSVTGFFQRLGGQSTVLGEQTEYMTMQQLEAASVAASLNQVHQNLTQTFTSEARAIQQLAAAYQSAVAAQSRMPGGFSAGAGRPRKFATGGLVPGSGNGDTVPAMLTPGEFVLTKDTVKQYGPLIQGMVAGNIKGFQDGGLVGSATAGASNPKAVADFLQNQLSKAMAAGGDTLVAEFTKFMQDFVNKTESITVRKLKDAMRSNEELVSQFNKNMVQQNKAQFAHVGEMGNMTATQLSKSATISNPRGMENLERLLKILPDTTLRPRSGFGYDIQGSVNNALGGAGASAASLKSAYGAAGSEKWATAVASGGGNFEQLKSQIDLFDAEMARGIDKAIGGGAQIFVDLESQIDQAEASATKAGKKFDRSVYASMESITKTSLKNIRGVGDELTQVFAIAERTITEVRGTISQAEKDLIMQKDPDLWKKMSGRSSGGDFTLLNASSSRFRGKAGGAGELNAKNARKAGVATATTVVQDFVEGMEQGAKATAQTASPSRVTTKIGADTAQGYINGVSQGVDDAARIGAQTANLAYNVEGPLLPGQGRDKKPPLGGRLGRVKGMLSPGKMAGAGFAAVGAAGAASMIPGPVGEAAQGLMGPLLALSGILPLIATKFGAIALLLAAIPAAIIATNMAFDNAQKSAMELTKALSGGEKAIRGFSEFTGTVTAGEIMDKRRAGQRTQNAVQSGKGTFGESFIQSEAGSAMMESVGAAVKQMGKDGSIESIANQLATGVASGALSTEQAKSIAANIGMELGDYDFGIDVNGKLDKLLGPNGENLLEDPLKVRLEILEDTQSKLNLASGAGLAGAAAIRGTDIGQIGGGIAAGAGAGAGIGAAAGLAFGPAAAVASPIGAVVGTVVGAISGGIVGSIERNDRIAKATGAVVALNQIALQQQQEMLDSLDLDYQRRIDAAKAAGDMVKAAELENDYIRDRAVLLEENKQLMQDIANNFSSQNADVQGALTSGAFKSIESQFKDTPLQDVAAMASDSVKNANLTQQQEYVLAMKVSSGDLSPIDVVDMLETFKSGEELDQVMNLIMNMDSAKFDSVMYLANQFTNEEVKKDFVANINAKLNDTNVSAEEIQGYIDTLMQVQKMEPVVDIEASMTYLINNEDQLNALQTDLETIKNTEDVSISVIANSLGEAELAALNDQAAFFDSLPESTQKEFLSNVRTIYSTTGTKEFAGQYQSAVGAGFKGSKETYATALAIKTTNEGIRARNAQKKAAYEEDVASSSGGGGGGGSAGTVQKVKTLDNLLVKLRQVRAATTSMTEGWNESRTAIDGLFGNGIAGFNGLEQQMRKFGARQDLISMIAGMDPDEYERRKNELFTFDAAGNISGFRQSLVSIAEAMRSIAMGDFQNKQQQTIQTINDQQVAIRKLVNAGMSYTDAYQAVQDTAFASAVAMEKNNDVIKQTIKDANAAATATRNLAAAQAVAAKNAEAVDQGKLLEFLEQNASKLTDVQTQAILSDKNLQTLALSPNFDPNTFQTALDNAANQADIDLKIKKLTIGGMEEIFQDGFSKAMEAFSVSEQAIKLRFNVQKEPLEDAISAAQQQIQDLQDGPGGLDDLDADLQRIAWQEDKINEKYKKRMDALSDVQKINERIARQQRQQLTIADALSQGDIAAAARAVQEMRAQNAQDNAAKQQKNMEIAREREIANLTSTMGLTREQLESRVLDLKQQIFAIEESAIEPAQYRLTLLERAEQVEIDSLTVLGKTKTEWETIKNNIDFAKISSESYQSAIEDALDVVRDIENYWNNIDGKQVAVDVVVRQIGDVNLPAMGPVVPAVGPAAEAVTGGGSGEGSGGSAPAAPEYEAEIPEIPLPSVEDRKKPIEVPEGWPQTEGWWQSLMALGELATEGWAMIGEWWNTEGPGKYINEWMTAFGGWWDRWVVTPVRDWINGIATWWNEGPGAFFNTVFTTIGTWWDTYIVKPIKGFFDWFFGPSSVEKKKQDIIAFVGSIGNFFKGLFDNIGRWIGQIPGFFRNAVNGAIGFLGQIGQWFGSLPGLLASAIGSLAANMGNALKGAVNGIFNIMRGVNILGWKPFSALPRLAKGGQIPGKGNEDNYPALLMPGEFVIRKDMVNKYGVGLMEQINSGKFETPTFDLDSPGGKVQTTSTTAANSVYNNTYSINVNVKSDANPDQIARAVMTQIKQVDAQRIRGNRF